MPELLAELISWHNPHKPGGHELFRGILFTCLNVSLFFLSSGVLVLLRVKLALWRHMRNGSNIPSIFAQTVAQHPDKPALVYEATGETWTFTELDQLCNAVAQWALSQGWASGDVVALLMESRPLQVVLWLGLAKIGIESALINFNLRRDSLMHCLSVSGARALVFGAELADGKEFVTDARFVSKFFSGI